MGTLHVSSRMGPYFHPLMTWFVTEQAGLFVGLGTVVGALGFTYLCLITPKKLVHLLSGWKHELDICKAKLYGAKVSCI